MFAFVRELKNSGIFIPETLSLSASTSGIMPSNTSEMQKQFFARVSQEYGLSQQKYFDLITSRDKDMPKYNDVCDEFDNMVIVQDYFMIMFLEELLILLNAPDNMRNNIKGHLYNKQFMESIMNLIKKFGLENYKRFVDDYNNRLKRQQEDLSLVTPAEIINSGDRQLK